MRFELIPMLFEHLGLGKDKKFLSLIFYEDCTYLLRLSKEVYQRELAKVAYHAL